MKVTGSYIILLGLLIILTGCSNYYYAPNSHNVPLFRSKNEFRGDVKGIWGDNLGGTELQAGYSLSDKIGVITNFISAGGGSFDKTGRGGRGWLAEVGVGYYKPLNPDLVFELYGGSGLGRVSNIYYWGRYYGRSDINIIRTFIQPDIGFTHDIADVALSARICHLRYTNIKLTELDATSTTASSQIASISRQPDNILIEPALTVRFGWKFVKLQLQATYSHNFMKGIGMRKFTFSTGISFNITERYIKNGKIK